MQFGELSLDTQTIRYSAPALFLEMPDALDCPSCEEKIVTDKLVRPRFDYVLCPHCSEEFIPNVFLL